MFHSDETLYRQLYLHIRALIREGIIADGMKLPSIRSLGRQLNVSKTTVETAYHMLLEEGYVVSKERIGLLVVNPVRTDSAKPAEANIIAPETADPELDDTEQARKQAPIDFSLLTVDGDSFPVRLWKSLLGEALDVHGRSLHEYGDPRGEYALRASLAHYLRQSRGVLCSPEQIIVGTGISYSIYLLSKLSGPSPGVAIEKPGIAQVRQIFARSGFRISPYSMPDSEDSDQKMPADIRMLYVTPSHRPSGEPLPYAARQRLLQWAYDRQVDLIEDDYDGELRLTGRPVPALQSLDSNGSVIYIGSFSKVFTPAVRMNYMVLPVRLLQKLHASNPFFSCPSRVEQWAMELLIARGHWYRHLRRMRKIYRHKRETLIRMIQNRMPDAVQIGGSGSGLHIELSISADVCAEELVGLARRQGVLVYGDQDDAIRLERGHPSVYLGFGGVNEHEMELGVQRLKQAWSAVLLTRSECR
ncbi:PLP-dependent aminotransferase family protein [Paenibacillaceae bacterium WGS1546]|uniref:MocR-like pyridoxine biosynthesis transcription factor PdxR n=1 Tax=Cohnella sp. WGS1546 TaxID=3366810 RepID=UPI00372CF345